MTSFYHYRALRKFNKNGVKSSLSQISRFIIPGFISGVISAILHAIDQGSDGNYVRYIGWERSVVGQGAMQLLGIALSIGIGIFAGLIVGLLFKCVGRGANYHIQFNDNFIYKAEGESVKNHWFCMHSWIKHLLLVFIIFRSQRIQLWWKNNFRFKRQAKWWFSPNSKQLNQAFISIGTQLGLFFLVCFYSWIVGFYFLIFGIVELVTNYSLTSYSTQL